MRDFLWLWSSNQPLLDAAGQSYADDALQVLIEALWQHLQDRKPRLH